jgi:DNA-binding NarL/FixJ family response regulator
MHSTVSIRVILGEDSYLAREGIERVLERTDGVELVGTYADLDGLSAAVERDRPDVVLTDIRMPPTNTDEGIRLAKSLRETHPEIGVVVISQHANAGYAAELLENGSGKRAYLLKERVTNAVDLGDAVRSVADGGSVIDPLVVESLVKTQQVRAESHLDQLTRRELEILGLIAQGKSNAAIADSLVLTKRAVEHHINAIFTKLDLGAAGDVSRRVQAALLYLARDSG